jgi:hypothetical protein
MSSNSLEKAASVRRSAGEQIKAIQADRDLTPVAKGRRIAEIRQRANDEGSKLRAGHAREQEQTRTRLHGRLFGLGFRESTSEAEKHAARASYRDAIFRADALQKPQDALRMLTRAQMIGDKLLAKAIATVSYERGWSGVLESHASADESFSADIQELREFEHQMASANGGMRENIIGFAGLSEQPEESAARAADITGEASSSTTRAA